MFERWKLKRERRNVIALYEKAIADCKADKNKDKDDLECLYVEMDREVGMADDALNAFESDRLFDEARKLDVETPAINDADGLWQEDYYTHRRFLNAKGRSNVRRLIDAEKLRRFEVSTLWVAKVILPLLGLIIGILGALTGLLAVLRHKP